MHSWSSDSELLYVYLQCPHVTLQAVAQEDSVIINHLQKLLLDIL